MAETTDDHIDQNKSITKKTMFYASITKKELIEFALVEKCSIRVKNKLI